jgi:S1-C subfamily serine protease
MSQSAKEIAKRSFPSVAIIFMEDKNGQPISLGSGFFVKNDIIATSMHVVRNAERGYIKLINRKTKYDIKGVVATNADADLVLLKIGEVTAPPLKLADSKLLEIGDDIYVVGNPQGFEGTFSQGIISGFRDLGSYSLLQITAPISPGSSGGPVLDKKGDVIGISFATFRGGQNLNFAVPSNYLSSLLKELHDVQAISSLPGNSGSVTESNELGEEPNKAIVGEHFKWGRSMDGPIPYSFSLHNNLRQNVSDIYCIVIFYDENSKPVDTDVIYYNEVIHAGLAKRMNSQVDRSVYGLNTKFISNDGRYSTIEYPVEIRILNFKILE